jgi:hypothetical protein
LKDLYQTDANFRLEANMIPALAFVPVDNIAAAFHSLNGLAYVDHLLPVLAYFEAFYIGKPLQNGMVSYFLSLFI